MLMVDEFMTLQVILKRRNNAKEICKNSYWLYQQV
jgi:hypothetical protein